MYHCSSNKLKAILSEIHKFVAGNAPGYRLGITLSSSSQQCEHVLLLPVPHSSLLLVSCPPQHLSGLQLHVGTEYEIIVMQMLSPLLVKTCITHCMSDVQHTHVQQSPPTPPQSPTHLLAKYTSATGGTPCTLL